MRVTGLFAIGVTTSALLISGAFAEDAPRPAGQDGAKPATACCNPAAGNKWVKRPPGVYTGMPLRPGDIGYVKPKK